MPWPFGHIHSKRGESVLLLACCVHQPKRVIASADTLFVNPKVDSPWDLGAFRMLAECRCAGGGQGGDFYAFGLRGPNRLAVVIGDACGRGEDGARLLPNVLNRLAGLTDASVRPRDLLRSLNRRLADELSSDRFVTGAAFEIDAQRGVLTVANAGHVPAMVRRASGAVTLIGHASGPPLGIFADADYFEDRCKLGRGDVVVLMTDGILEAVETDLAEMPRLTALLSETNGGSGAVHRSLLAHLATRQGNWRGDDMTLLSLELLTDPGRPRPSNFQQSI
jgi:phosphoserine phosphatase RsbU/P